MVNTRGQRLREEEEVSETQSNRPPRSQSSVRGTGGTEAIPPRPPQSAGGTNAVPPRTPPASDPMPPRSPRAEAGPPPPPLPASPSLSNATFAGPGQRGRQLLSLANPFDREAYMIGLEKLNETFARALRQNGVQIPPCEYSILFLLINVCFSLLPFGL